MDEPRGYDNPIGHSPAVATRDDGVTEYGFLAEPEVLEAPDGDPRKRGTIAAAVQGRRSEAFHPQPPPPDHPLARDALVVASPTTDLLVARTIEDGLGGLYDTERRRRDAADALRDYDPRRRP